MSTAAIKDHRIVYVAEVGEALVSSYISHKHDNLARVSNVHIDLLRRLWFIWQETRRHDSLVQSKDRVVTTMEKKIHKNGS